MKIKKSSDMYDADKLFSKESIIKNKKNAKYLGKPGIYFLINDSEIIYIGRGNIVWQRLASHMTNKVHDFDSYTVIECNSIVDSKFLETAYIRKFLPINNKNEGDGMGATSYSIHKASERAYIHVR